MPKITFLFIMAQEVMRIVLYRIIFRRKDLFYNRFYYIVRSSDEIKAILTEFTVG